MTKNTKIPSLSINKTQTRLYAASSDPTFEHATYQDMETYLTNPTSYIGQLLYCKANDKHYRIAKGNNGQKILKEIVAEMTADNVSYNNPELPNANNVKSALDTLKTQVAEGGLLKIVNTLEDADNIPGLRDGMICYIEEDKAFFSREDGKWVTFKGDTGGVTIGTLTSDLDEQTLSITVGDPLVVDLFFATPNIGNGTLYVTSNGKEILNQPIKMGKSEITLNLKKDTHKLEIYVKDRANVYTNVVKIKVQCGGLDLQSSFDWQEDYPLGSYIEFPYEIDTISTDPITMHFKIDNQEYTETAENGHNSYVFPELGVGAYSVEIWAESGGLKSNIIKETLVILASGSLYVSSLFDKTEAEEGDQLAIDYRISMQKERQFIVEYLINDKPFKESTGVSGTNTFLVSDLPLGPNKITIKVFTSDRGQSAQVEINIKIKKSSYELQQPITQGLLAHFDAFGLNNSEKEKHIWRDKTGKYTGTLHNFNYSSNGWIENGLKMNGSAYTKIDLAPFATNALTGLTIDIEFLTEDVGNENARVLDCTTRLESGIGCYIDTSTASIKSDASTIEASFAEQEKTRITYVIDRVNKLTKLYINAVLCNVSILKDEGTGNDKVLENYKHEECIYLNSKKGLSDFGECTVYNLRIYNRALKSEDVLQNYIADIKDKAEQKKKWDFNHKDTIPTMYFTGDITSMTKENPVDLRIKYVSTNEALYGKSFDLKKCSVKWQGTSSLDYAVKNYKIKLYEDPTGKEEEGAKPNKFKHALRENMIEESTFVLKADYMESSHANNTGLAKIVNRYLYETPLPPQVKDKRVVSAIDGFPIKLYVNEKLYGVYNFNLDKGNDKSFGFDKKNPTCLSYEVRANTDTTAGAFNKWTEEKGQETGKATELEYLQADFELRFPDEDDVGKDYGYETHLKKLVDWVDSSNEETFKREFDQHFNREYTFKYYLFVLIMGMVDNLGKNMMLCTWDGDIWYPCFYDLDTCLALDNSGYISFDCDIEMTDKNTYNTSGSKLWTKVGKCFEKELKEMYVKMRTNKFKEKNIFDVLIGEQIDQIPELLYNEDSQKKYIDHSEYIHMLHGNRREHMRRWIRERLLYLDSKLGYEEHTKETLTVRANKLGEVHFDIKTYSPMYIKVRWRSGTEQIEKINRGETKRFTSTLPVDTDQEILIYAAKHLKEIGDISHMNPTTLLLGNATKLTKLICKDSPRLQSIGIGNTSAGGVGLKNLQELNLTNCSKLGTVTGNNGLDISNCVNLRTVYLQGTSLQNIKLNPKGGNLEELYLPNSLTSLHLNKEYRLTKVVFPAYNGFHNLRHMETYRDGSKITHLNIIDCPNLSLLGVDTQTNKTNSTYSLNYRRTPISQQAKDFDISAEEYNKMYSLSCFGRLEQVKIDNSLLNYKYWNINVSPNLATASFNNMSNLKGLVLTGNRTYGDVNYAVESSNPSFERISVNHCDKFEDLILQNGGHYYQNAYKFKKDFVWDLSDLKLKRFIACIGLQNLKKIILPTTIEEFSHSYTQTTSSSDASGQYGTVKLTKEMCPLDTIVIDGQHENNEFTGIDLGNKKLKNVSLAGLTQKVDIIQNIDCKAIDIIPRMSPGLKTQQFKNIKIDFNDYKLNSMNSLFEGMDMSQLTLLLNKSLSSSTSMDYMYTFRNARNVYWDNIKDFITKLPKGNLYHTFYGCDIDKLEVEIGNIIRSTSTNMQDCFQAMPNVTTIDLSGTDTIMVGAMNGFAGNCPKLKNLNLSTFDMSKVGNINYMFSGDGELTNVVFFKKLAVSYYLADLSKLTAESMMTLIDNLAVVSTRPTLTLGQWNLARLNDDQRRVATSKGWTLA